MVVFKDGLNNEFTNAGISSKQAISGCLEAYLCKRVLECLVGDTSDFTSFTGIEVE